MRFEISRQRFLEMVQGAQGVIDFKSAAPLLNNVWVGAKNDRVHVFATDLDLSFCDNAFASVERDGAITVSAKKLFEVIKSLDSESILFDVGENNWVRIVSGATEYKLVGFADSHYPSKPESEGEFFNVSVEMLKDLITKTAYSASADKYHNIYNGVLMVVKDGVVTMVSTNGHRLAKAKSSTDIEGNYEVLIPRKGLLELLRIIPSGEETVATNVEKDKISFIHENIYFSIRLIDGKFPDYERIIPKPSGHNMVISRLDFLDACKRTSLFADIKTHTISLLFDQGYLKVQSNTPEYGEASDQIAIDYQGDEVKLHMNVFYLLEMLRVFDSDDIMVRFDKDGPVVFEPIDGEYMALIMPMLI